MDDEAQPSAFEASVAELMARTTCRAVTGEEFEQVCRLRYDAYRREGTLPENAPVRFTDRFDLTPNATTYGLFIDGKLASSIRLHVASPDMPDLPASQVFADHVEPWLEAGETIIDPTRFVSDAEASQQFPKIAYLTLRIVWIAFPFFRADRLLAAVRTEHQAFYRRIWGHKPVCAARPYPSLSKPISLMALDPVAAANRVHARYPYLRSTEAERTALFSGCRLPRAALAVT